MYVKKKGWLLFVLIIHYWGKTGNTLACNNYLPLLNQSLWSDVRVSRPCVFTHRVALAFK